VGNVAVLRPRVRSPGSRSEAEVRVMVEFDPIQRSTETAVLILRGELAGRLWTKVVGQELEEQYVDDGVRRIELDLSRLTFLDNHGVATLVALREEAAQRGKEFVVTLPEGQVEEKLRVTGVLKLLMGGR
jgi:anti-anti-sigma factor